MSGDLEGRRAPGAAPRTLTAYQAKYAATELDCVAANPGLARLSGLLFDAQIEPKPHQIDAALFALQSPLRRGAILADEVGLGKTIEAGIVIAQHWAERRRRILIIAPSSLRQQWQQELDEKFLLPSALLDRGSRDGLLAEADSPRKRILICSYEFVLRNTEALRREWDLVVADEAHRLRNHYNGSTKGADAVAAIVEGAAKTLLLTATPLQNRLEEVYGLVSVFEPGYFRPLDAFRARYVGTTDLGDLRERIAGIAKRTLRRDAAKYIRFTERLPLTIRFSPTRDEARLYELVNAYLQRPGLYAFAGSRRHLASLIIRKRLGSSTSAVASTLTNIANRLADELAAQRASERERPFELDGDLTDEEREDAERVDGESTRNATDPAIAAGMRAEIDELRGYARLAASITVNGKAERLGEALGQGFAKLRELGAPEKAIIFTESTKTQAYLVERLRELGYRDGVVCFNGTNTDPAQTDVYRRWLAANAGSDLVTGVATADRRKALVDEFRDRGRIMIATEAAAEGINLQFCSMLVNYDLPWNPQRVEQRIGRVHRYGQRYNVVVVNFFNADNVAEQRILQLLTEKFKLFESVFGASDEVLGTIEDGLGFEKAIARILDRCKSAEEISAAFDELEARYSVEISREMAQVKAKVFDNLDPHVRDRLRDYDVATGEALNRFEQRFAAVTRWALEGIADFDGDGRRFTLLRPPVAGVPVGRYALKPGSASEPTPVVHRLRFASRLGEHIVTQARSAPTPPCELIFSVGASDRVSAAARNLVGAVGALAVDCTTFLRTARGEDASESHLVRAARTDDGAWLDDELIDDLLELECVAIAGVAHGRGAPDSIPVDRLGADAGSEVAAALAAKLDERRRTLDAEVRQRSTSAIESQEEQLDRNLADLRAEFDAKIEQCAAKEQEFKRAARRATDPVERVRLRRTAQRWARRRDAADSDRKTAENELRRLQDAAIDALDASLTGGSRSERLFTVRWRVTA